MKKIIRFIVETTVDSPIGAYLLLLLMLLGLAGIGFCGYWLGQNIHWTIFRNLNIAIGYIIGILTSGGLILLIAWILGKISNSIMEDEDIAHLKDSPNFWDTCGEGYTLLASMLIAIGIITGLVLCLIYFVKWLFAK
jgi:hypothetical protein